MTNNFNNSYNGIETSSGDDLFALGSMICVTALAAALFVVANGSEKRQNIGYLEDSLTKISEEASPVAPVNRTHHGMVKIQGSYLQR